MKNNKTDIPLWSFSFSVSKNSNITGPVKKKNANIKNPPKTKQEQQKIDNDKIVINFLVVFFPS